MDDLKLHDAWASARTLSDLSEATIEFLEGRLQETPVHWGPIDPESNQLVPILVSMNRAGLITTCSQPGMTDVEHRGAQRAFVEGFCDRETAEKIETGLLLDELVVISCAPSCESFISITVTVDDDKPFTFLGRFGNDELNAFRNGDRELDEMLDQAWALQIFDPVWGRNDRLWASIFRALTSPPKSDRQ